MRDDTSESTVAGILPLDFWIPWFFAFITATALVIVLDRLYGLSEQVNIVLLVPVVWLMLTIRLRLSIRHYRLGGVERTKRALAYAAGVAVALGYIFIVRIAIDLLGVMNKAVVGGVVFLSLGLLEMDRRRLQRKMEAVKAGAGN